MHFIIKGFDWHTSKVSAGSISTARCPVRADKPSHCMLCCAVPCCAVRLAGQQAADKIFDSKQKKPLDVGKKTTKGKTTGSKRR